MPSLPIVGTEGGKEDKFPPCRSSVQRVKRRDKFPPCLSSAGRVVNRGQIPSLPTAGANQTNMI